MLLFILLVDDDHIGLIHDRNSMFLILLAALMSLKGPLDLLPTAFILLLIPQRGVSSSKSLQIVAAHLALDALDKCILLELFDEAFVRVYL